MVLDRYQDALTMGKAAYHRGETIEDCPYATQPFEWEHGEMQLFDMNWGGHWLAGHFLAQQEQQSCPSTESQYQEPRTPPVT